MTTIAFPHQQPSQTRVSVQMNSGAGTAEEIGWQVARLVRGARQHNPGSKAHLPAVPFRRQDLFREPVYADGQAYADQDDEDEAFGD